jgi:hypothetical protein
VVEAGVRHLLGILIFDWLIDVFSKEKNLKIMDYLWLISINNATGPRVFDGDLNLMEHGKTLRTVGKPK